jgi:hypothetical protein
MGQSVDAIENALAHTVKDAPDGGHHAEHAAERRQTLQLWADFVDAQIESSRQGVIG